MKLLFLFIFTFLFINISFAGNPGGKFGGKGRTTGGGVEKQPDEARKSRRTLMREAAEKRKQEALKKQKLNPDLEEGNLSGSLFKRKSSRVLIGSRNGTTGETNQEYKIVKYGNIDLKVNKKTGVLVEEVPRPHLKLFLKNMSGDHGGRQKSTALIEEENIAKATENSLITYEAENASIQRTNSGDLNKDRQRSISRSFSDMEEEDYRERSDAFALLIKKKKAELKGRTGLSEVEEKRLAKDLEVVEKQGDLSELEQDVTKRMAYHRRKLEEVEE